ncbi:MAG: DUF3482 domain-containing protein [Acidobacteria bacterium]|nr:MAG: DUF3482 domain-containing protein [Acidobacteriota bacterium]
MSERDQPQTSRRIVTLSLASHTNVGKTTLARTLLRRDVGEVLDQAHVTELSEAYDLIEADGAVLRLYDTPGFGDSARLLKRLVREKNRLLWFLQQTWDRFTDRPLWCSQQAMLTVRDATDVVLYLVNAAEDPAEAGYVAPELELLSWVGRPVLLILNQVGDGAADRTAVARRRAAWQRHVEGFEVVKGVLDLDAFNRCWVQEGILFEAVVPLLPPAQRQDMERLARAWEARNRRIFDRTVRQLARYLAGAAADRVILPEPRPGRAEKQAAMEELGGRLVRATEALMAELLAAHGLEGTPPAEVERAVDAFVVAGEETLTPERGALWGGIVSGALSGLAADALSGGLSLGGGLIAGAILGALGGAGLARGYQLARGDESPEIRWSSTFLDRLASQTLLRYLAVAHYGRGRGAFQVFEEPERWRMAVAAARAAAGDAWLATWRRLTAGDWPPETGERRLVPMVGAALEQVLADAYPEAGPLLATWRRTPS